MPLTDRREIEFDSHALLAAIAASPRAAGIFGLPALPPSGARFYPEQGEVDFLYGAREQKAVRLKAEYIGALLVAHCIRAKIPAPRKAEKGVRVKAASVVLEFRTELDDVPAAVPERNLAGASAGRRA